MIDESRLRAIADELSLSVTDDCYERYHSDVAELRSSVDQLRTESETTAVTSTSGTWSDDEYGALLDRYDNPRASSTNGPLVGTTFAIKDNIAVQNLRMTCGLDEFSIVPSTDATVVERLLHAGGRIVGKSNMDALALGPTGTESGRRDVWNPIDPERISGGSSSGSGVAVAAGLTDAALGSDTGGSVRIPAACCGIVGVKPSHRLIPRDGFVDLAPSLDTIGVLTQDVSNATTILETLQNGNDHDRPREPASLSFGIPTPFFDAATFPIRKAIDNLQSRLEAKGHSITDIGIPTGAIGTAYSLIVSTEFVWLLRQSGIVRGDGPGYCDTRLSVFSSLLDSQLPESVTERLLPAAVLDEETDGTAYATARQEANRFVAAFTEAFDTVDLLLVPTLPDLPPDRGATSDVLGLLANTSPFNVAGVPAVSLPISEHAGLPLSVQVIAPQFEDARALSGAQRIENIAAGFEHQGS